MKDKPRAEGNTGRGWWLAMVAGLALALTAVGSPAHAVALSCPGPVVSTPDADNDGYTDAEENNGVTLADGTVFPGATSGLPRAERLDPSSPDLFVIVTLTTPSNFPADFLAVFAALGVTAHVVPATQVFDGLLITCFQRAVKLVESDDTNGTLWGSTDQGIPTTGINIATVFSQRIVNHIDNTFNQAGDFTTDRAPVKATCIKQTAAHELSHLVSRETTYNKRYGGYHHKTGSGFVMDQSVVVSGTQYNCPTAYGAEDPSGTFR